MLRCARSRRQLEGGGISHGGVFLMKVQIVVKLKDGVLDPQGQAIQRSLKKLGHKEISRVRQGRYFELEIDDQDQSVVTRLSEQIAADVLSNPIIEDFEIRQIT